LNGTFLVGELSPFSTFLESVVFVNNDLLLFSKSVLIGDEGTYYSLDDYKNWQIPWLYAHTITLFSTKFSSKL